MKWMEEGYLMISFFVSTLQCNIILAMIDMYQYTKKIFTMYTGAIHSKPSI